MKKEKDNFIFYLLIFILIIALCSLYLSSKVDIIGKSGAIFGGGHNTSDNTTMSKSAFFGDSEFVDDCQKGNTGLKGDTGLTCFINKNGAPFDYFNDYQIQSPNKPHDMLQAQSAKPQTSEDIKKELFINHNSKLMIDGHNLIHALSKKHHLTLLEFKNNLNRLSQILTDSLINYPNLSYNFVLKNPNIDQMEKYETLHELEKLKKPKGIDALTKKVVKENSLYVSDLIEMSKLFPKIKYHLAYDKSSPSNLSDKNNKKRHHTKGRDDLLSIYLSDGNYIISNDKFRDVGNFYEIPEFYHIEICNGKVIEREHINPKKFINLKKPDKGSHLSYKFIPKNEQPSEASNIEPNRVPPNIEPNREPNIKSGDIFIINGTPTIYLFE